jgi:hypothetical protein
VHSSRPLLHELAPVKIKLLNQTHPDFDARELAELGALYEGGERWRALVKTSWLPKNAKEPADVYQDRVKRALYTNDAGPVCDRLSAALFAEAPQIEGLPAQDYWSTLLTDCDGKSTPWGTWWGARFTEALTFGVAWAWVNLPRRPAALEPGSRAEEEAAGLLDAYLVAWTADQVLDWTEDERGRLTGVMVHDVVSERATPGAPRRRTWRWTWIDAARLQRWSWTETDKQDAPTPDDDAREDFAIEHGLGRIPVVRLQLPEGLHAMGKLRDPAVRLLRGRCDLDWALHKAAHALLAIKSEWDDGDPVLGPGYFYKLGPQDEIAYAEPSGRSFTALGEDLVKRREDLYRVVDQMALSVTSDAARSQMSGASKAEDWRPAEIVLGAYARLMKRVMAATLELIASVRDVALEELSIAGLDGWQSEDLLTFLDGAEKASDARALSPTFARLVAKRQAERLLQDEVSPEELDVVRAEIDAAEIADPGAPDPGAGEGAAQDTALNGAQVQSALQVVQAVALGQLPREAGVTMIAEFFNLGAERAERIVGEVGRDFTPTPPAA